jgi:hypothetical protein
MATIRDDRQCSAHQQVIEAISDMRGIVDDRLEHITGRVDRIYEMLATARQGGGNGSANTLTVTASAAPPPPAPAPPAPAPPAQDGAPWGRILVLLATLAGALVALVQMGVRP